LACASFRGRASEQPPRDTAGLEGLRSAGRCHERSGFGGGAVLQPASWRYERHSRGLKHRATADDGRRLFGAGGGVACGALPTHLHDWLVRGGRKAALLLAIFVLAATALFLAVRAVPGDPVALRLKRPDPVRVAALRAQLGLDDPAPVQWVRYLGNFATGNWGRSITSNRVVLDDVAEYLPATIELSLAALGLGIVLGAAMAIGAEVFRFEMLRRLSFALGTIGLTVPVFWVGLLLLVIGSAWLGWFPSSGRLDVSIITPPAVTGFLTIDALLAGDGAAFFSALRHLALPALCLSLFQAAYVCSVLQGRLQDVRLKTLVISLRARGLRPVRIWFRHLLRVVSAPVLAVIGTHFGALLGGAVLTETVFSWPGVGRYLVTAVITRDVFVVENVLLLVVLLVVAVVFVTDLLARVINPVAVQEEDDAP
jgi:ABC-type dipeptide/oligopeptide/nickel transport system permease component